jgi:hypothetical protein
MPRKLRACPASLRCGEEIADSIPFDFAHGKLVTSVHRIILFSLDFLLTFSSRKK